MDFLAERQKAYRKSLGEMRDEIANGLHSGARYLDAASLAERTSRQTLEDRCAVFGLRNCKANLKGELDREDLARLMRDIENMICMGLPHS